MVNDVQTNLRHYLVTWERETQFQLSQKGTIGLTGLVIYPYFSSNGPPSGTHYRSSQCRVSVLREWMVPWTQALLSMGVLRLCGLHRIHLDPGGHCCWQNDSKFSNLTNIAPMHSDELISALIPITLNQKSMYWDLTNIVKSHSDTISSQLLTITWNMIIYLNASVPMLACYHHYEQKTFC